MPHLAIRSLALSVCLLAAYFFAAAHARPGLAQNSPAAQAVWSLEHEYWQDVERNDLDAYRKLWDENFMGWPMSSSLPVGKSGITGWITSQTSKGLTFKLVQFKQASLVENGDLVVACYWITARWDSKSAPGDEYTTRILHTWQHRGNRWQIVSGMSSYTKDEESR